MSESKDLALHPTFVHLLLKLSRGWGKRRRAQCQILQLPWQWWRVLLYYTVIIVIARVPSWSPRAASSSTWDCFCGTGPSALQPFYA